MGPRRDEEDRVLRTAEGGPQRFGGTACGSLLRNGLWIRVWGTGRDRPGSGGSDRRGGTLPSRRNGAMTSGRATSGGGGTVSPERVDAPSWLWCWGSEPAPRSGRVRSMERAKGRDRAQGADQGGDPGRQSQSSGLLESLLGARSSGRPGGRPPSVRRDGRRSQR